MEATPHARRFLYDQRGSTLVNNNFDRILTWGSRPEGSPCSCAPPLFGWRIGFALAHGGAIDGELRGGGGDGRTEDGYGGGGGSTAHHLAPPRTAGHRCPPSDPGPACALAIAAEGLSKNDRRAGAPTSLTQRRQPSPNPSSSPHATRLVSTIVSACGQLRKA